MTPDRIKLMIMHHVCPLCIDKTPLLIFFIFTILILLAEKFLESDWLRREVFQPNLKYPHVEITVAVKTEETVLSCC